jgi:hypothetical protein
MDVGEWLRNFGLGEYQAAFRDNAIDEQVLRDLTAEDLKEIGATVGDRRKLLAGSRSWPPRRPRRSLARRPSAAERPKTPEASAERHPLTS